MRATSSRLPTLRLISKSSRVPVFMGSWRDPRISSERLSFSFSPPKLIWAASEDRMEDAELFQVTFRSAPVFLIWMLSVSLGRERLASSNHWRTRREQKRVREKTANKVTA